MVTDRKNGRTLFNRPKIRAGRSAKVRRRRRRRRRRRKKRRRRRKCCFKQE
jgi:hypothetical protein